MTLGTNHVVNYNGQNVRIVNDWHELRFRGNDNYAAFYSYNNNYGCITACGGTITTRGWSSC